MRLNSMPKIVQGKSLPAIAWLMMTFGSSSE